MNAHPEQLADLNAPCMVATLREIRTQQAGIGQRLTRVERKVEELQRAAVTDRHGEAIDAAKLELEELRTRIAALEAKA